VEIRGNGGMGEAGFAACSIEAGQTVFECRGLVMPVRTMYTICMTLDTHLLFGEGAQCLAHSCDPNVRVRIHEDFQGFDFVATRHINPGDLVCFNYLTTEWTMQAPFRCLCGHANCFGEIAGLRNQPASRQLELLPYCSPAVQELHRRHNEELRRISTAKRGDVVFDGASADDLIIGSTPSECYLRTVGRQFRHSTTPSLVFVEGRLVALQDLTRETELTVDMRLLRYRLPEPLGGFAAVKSSTGSTSPTPINCAQTRLAIAFAKYGFVSLVNQVASAIRGFGAC